jgi:uncharacterized protein YdhG (YjbR/CyaY superfamily)
MPQGAISMQSQAVDVQTYIAEVPTERRTALQKLRILCRENLAGYQECIEYGMPSYKRDGVVKVSFASQKQYIALYVQDTAAVKDFRDSLSAASIGKCCIRFKNPDKIDFEVLSNYCVKARSPGRLELIL